MQIKVNNKPQEIEEAITVSALLVKNNVEAPDMVSVQLNGEFVRKEEYGTKLVKEYDEVEFLYFMGGGK